MELTKKKYKKEEVLELLNKYKSESNQKIDDLIFKLEAIKKEKSLAEAELFSCKQKESLINKTLEDARAYADAMQKETDLKYYLEEEKLKKLINHVEKLGLKYSRTKFPKLHTCHLFVLPYKIAVHICGEKDDEFRKKYKKRIFIHDDISVDDIIHNFDELASKLDWAYEHRDEIRERKQKNLHK